MYLRKLILKKQYKTGIDNQCLSIKKRKFAGRKLSYIYALAVILSNSSQTLKLILYGKYNNTTFRPN